ncbi:hypothetical protein RQM47_12410 [Rubrivirga sp. S365]
MPRPTLVATLALALAACGDPAAPGGAAPSSSAAGGAVGVEAPPVLDASALGAWLPASVGMQPRQAVRDTADAALGAEISRASATYGPDLSLSVTDLGTADMAEMMGYGWALGGPPPLDVDGHPAQASGGVGRPHTVRVLAGRRFLVEAESPDAAAAEAAARAVDLDGLARAGR